MRSAQIARAEAAAEREYQRSEQLLANILPRDVAERLKLRQNKIIADRFDDASVLFLDLAGSTALASRLSPEALVTFLNMIFTRLDEIVDRFGLEKIKTTGDGYMVVSGVPSPNAGHAERDCRLCARHPTEFRQSDATPTESRSPFRIGIESGPVVAGVVGTRKFFYDVWGDTVNVASRMESTCTVGRIQVGPNIAASLRARFVLIDRGEIEVRGKGSMRTWFLAGPDFLGGLAGPKLHTRVRFLSPAPLHGASLSLHRVHCLDRCLLQNRAASPALIRMPETGSRICCCRASHCACFQRARCQRPVQFRPMGTVGPRLRLCANRKCKRDCDDECSPHFSLPRVFYG